VDIEQMYDEAVLAASDAGPDDLADSEWHQHLTQRTYFAWGILRDSVPDIDETTRAEIAWEVAKRLRPGEAVVDGVRRWLPDSWRDRLKRDANDKLVANPMNCFVMLDCHPDVRGTIRFNLFSKQVEVSGGPLVARSKDDVDDIVSAAQDWIYLTEGVVMNFTDLGRRLVAVALKNAYDPIQNYFLNLKWDGVPRVMAGGGWLATYGGAKAETPGFVAQVGRKFLVSCVARGLSPGAKVDTILCLGGDQGLKKTSLLEVLGGPFYADMASILGDKDSKMMASSALILELPDMAGFKRSDKNIMKAFFTTRNDKFRAPFGRTIKVFPRRCVFATTTNDQEIFDDETGNRRYLTVYCDGVDGKMDLVGLLRERDQLWAEAVHIYLSAEGCPNCAKSRDVVWAQKPRCDEHSWWPDSNMAISAALENKERDDLDVWAPIVIEWVERPFEKDPMTGQEDMKSAVPITTTNVLLHAIGKAVDRLEQRDKIRVGKILKKAGWKAQKPYRGQRIYERVEPVNPLPTTPPPKLSIVTK
jgi:predicted P-loop ATPase